MRTCTSSLSKVSPFILVKYIYIFFNSKFLSFPGGLLIKSLLADGGEDGGDTGSIPGLGGSHMPDSN